MKNFIFTAVIVLFGVGGWWVFTPHANPQQTPTPSASSQAAGAYTLTQVAIHNSERSCWTAISGSVYDLTQFVGQHPGGQQAILSLCGTDGTDAFNAKHGGQPRPVQELAGLKIGTLAQ